MASAGHMVWSVSYVGEFLGARRRGCAPPLVTWDPGRTCHDHQTVIDRDDTGPRLGASYDQGPRTGGVLCRATCLGATQSGARTRLHEHGAVSQAHGRDDLDV